MVINNTLTINTNNIKKNIVNSLSKAINTDLYYIDTNGKDIINQDKKEIIGKNIIKNFLKEIDYILYLSMENNRCIYKFQKGKRVGEYCNRKIYIKTKNINFYCSRHNKTYDVMSRNYNIRKQCEHIKKDNTKCKHYVNNNSNFCFIHNFKEKESEFIFNYNYIQKLNRLRNIYYKKVKKKKCNNFFKQNKSSPNGELSQNKKNNNFSHLNFHKKHKNHFDNPTNLYIENSNYELYKNFKIFKIRKKKSKKSMSCR